MVSPLAQPCDLLARDFQEDLLRVLILQVNLGCPRVGCRCQQGVRVQLHDLASPLA